MKKCAVIIITFVFLALTVCCFNGCAAFRQSITDKDPSSSEALSAKYDQEDLLTLADQISKAILENPFPTSKDNKPIVADMGIRNRTKSHIDMQALADNVTTKLLESGKIRLANTSRRDDLLKEQGYQVSNCTPETRTRIGMQLGAKYILTGSLTEIEKRSGRQVRVSEKQDIYYQLTVKITNLETGLVEVQKQKDRLRRASKPIIGW
ncbi:hypothetical protein ACFLS1_03140 [Verrucomicrobiota bacterium]